METIKVNIKETSEEVEISASYEGLIDEDVFASEILSSLKQSIIEIVKQKYNGSNR